MKFILMILMIIVGLAYMSQRMSLRYKNEDGRKHWDIFLILLLIFLIMFAGLRISYNDTQNYAYGFYTSENIQSFLSHHENFKLTTNPLFYGFQAFIRTYTDNVNIFFMICAIIVNVFNVRFIKKHVDIHDFAFSMFIYVTLGTLMLSLAAQKQTLAMSVLTLALSQLFNKKYIKYYMIVFIAGLIHSYAWLFFFLPLMMTKPWSLRTYVLLLMTIVVMYTFQSTIATFVEVADQVGKNVPLEEVFDGNKMNLLRVAVYAVIPLITFFFRRRINENIDDQNSLFIQMSIVSLMFMLMGTMNGANMFGRCANYFEMGIICSLPWIIRQLFTKESVQIVMLTAMLCFTSFYLFDNKDFQNLYRRKGVTQFISEVIKWEQ